MKLKQLQALITLWENDCDFSIHKQLGLPRSTLWSYVNEIEKEVGIKFVDRKKQNNYLTEEGRDFLPYLKKMAVQFEQGLLYVAKSSERGASGQITIATTPALTVSWLAESLRAFKAQHPKIHLNIIAGDFLSPQTERVADILLRPMSQKPTLLRHWFISYQMGLWASAGYLARHGIPQFPEDLLGHSILGYGKEKFSYFPEVDWHLSGRWGELPRLTPTLTINSTKSLYVAAEQGLGICSAAEETNTFYRGKLCQVLPTLIGPQVNVYFCTQKSASEATHQRTHIVSNFLLAYLSQIEIPINFFSSNLQPESG